MVESDVKRGFAALLLITLGLPCLDGCGGDGRVGVSGTVTVDGAPLDSGTINFQPVDTGAANTSGADVAKGRFELPAAKGLMPGKYRVTVQAFKPSGRMVEDPDYGLVAEQMRIPFHESGTLEATVEEGGRNEFDFVLTSAIRDAR